MVMRETDKHFLMALFSATGIILFWRGVWEGVDALPSPINNIWLGLFLGTAMLTISGIIFKEFDPFGGIEKSTVKMMHYVHAHPQRSEFTVKYYDNLQKKEHTMQADDMRHIEKNVISFHHKGKEVFIPIHRVRSVHRNGKAIWRL